MFIFQSFFRVYFCLVLEWSHDSFMAGFLYAIWVCIGWICAQGLILNDPLHAGLHALSIPYFLGFEFLLILCNPWGFCFLQVDHGLYYMKCGSGCCGSALIRGFGRVEVLLLVAFVAAGWFWKVRCLFRFVCRSIWLMGLNACFLFQQIDLDVPCAR